MFDFVRLVRGSISERSIVFDEQRFWVSSIKFEYRTQSESNEPSKFEVSKRSIDYAGLIFAISQILACQGFCIINFPCFYFTFDMGLNYPSGILTSVIYESSSLRR